jgi:hypothetical protein
MDASIPVFQREGAGPVGTYALILGASKYPYLAGGSGDVAGQTYGLGQLAVSALTAYRFYEWIQSAYAFGSAPLKQCWLLLSPTEEELEVEPRLADFPAATMDNYVTAVSAFFSALQQLSRPQTEACRTIFFFSGHGIQRTEGQLVLLPSDFLKPPLRHIGDAIDARNLLLGLDAIPRGEDLFFVDACRLNPPEMAGLELTPRQVLQTRFTTAFNPARVASTVYAAASGVAAWQPKTPRDGISCFGQALIEGLSRLSPPPWPTCGHSPGATHLQLIDLVRFMRSRISELLAKGNSVVPRPIELTPFNELCVTELRAPAAAPVRDFPPPPVDFGGPGFGGPGEGVRGWEPAGDAAAPAATPLDDERPDATATLKLDWKESEQPGGWSFGLPQPETTALHDLFGHETVTKAWIGARFENIFGIGGPTPVVVERVRRGELGPHEKPPFLEIDFRPYGNEAQWAQLGKWNENEPLPQVGFVLPHGPGFEEPTFRLEMTHDLERQWAFELALSPASHGLLGRAAKLWQKFQDLEMSDMLKQIDVLAAKEVLQAKMSSPLAALVAASVLVRIGRGKERISWLSNLANFFPEFPDAVVFVAEVLRQGAPRDEPSVELWGQKLLQIDEKLLPFTSYGLSLAKDQTREALAWLKDHPTELGSGSNSRLQKFEKRLTAAMRRLHGRGLFAVYAGDEVSAEIVQP